LKFGFQLFVFQAEPAAFVALFEFQLLTFEQQILDAQLFVIAHQLDG
jgi:hypothetical protein